MAKTRLRRVANKNDRKFLRDNPYTQESPEVQDKLAWSIHDLKAIKPLNQRQASVCDAWFDEKEVFMYGCPGTGKSFLGLYLALSNIFENIQDKLVIIKSTVPSRDMGFTPGTIEEKTAPYEDAYHTLLHQLTGKQTAYKHLKRAGKIQFMSTAFLRGCTIDDAVIFIDEIQNMTEGEIDTVMTRTGKNSRVIACGDGKFQNDLINERGKAQSGFYTALDAITSIPEFHITEFRVEDIVRSGFVRSWIKARYQQS
jgi:phosphate starvation-inducible PhoH-like protein